MKVYTNEEVPQGSDEWQLMREGRITGTKLGHLFSKSKKTNEYYDSSKPLLGYYSLLAERLAFLDEDGHDSNIERGHRLEAEAIDRAEELLNKEFVRGGVWELNSKHIESPDGFTPDLKEAIEVKCLSSARHLMAIVNNEPPVEYEAEYMNYFLVNPDLTRLYITLYDPRFVSQYLQLYIFTVERKDVADKLEMLKIYVEEVEDKLDKDIDRLTDGR